jgi:HEXXH motif-containing protein
MMSVETMAVEALRIDLERVKAFIANAPPAPTSGFLLPPTGSARGVLQALLARRTLRRLLKAVARLEPTSSPEDRRLYQRCVDALLGQPDAALEVLCTEPELTSWVALAETPPGARQPLATGLALLLLPELVALDGAPVDLTLAPDTEGAFSLRRPGVRLVPDAPVRELQLRVGQGLWAMVTPQGTFEVHPRDGLPGFTVQQVPRLLGTGPHLLPAPTDWLSRNVPDELHTASGPEFVEFVEAMTSGAELLQRHWPEAWEQLRQSIRLLLPLRTRGKLPHNYSVHGFRGLIVSSPRRTYMAAQSLAHETGHNKLSTLIDLFPLCANPNVVVVSPVVQADRTLPFVFHGCFAFCQDILLTRRLIPALQDAPTASLEKYLRETTDKVSAALEVLDQHAVFEPVGRSIRDEVAAVLAG